MSEYPAFQYAAWLTKLVDGDTLHCGIDLGCDVAINQTIRFYGINAPEMSTAEGKTAKAFAQAWFDQHCVTGQFILQTIKDSREKYGRYLGIILATDGSNLNDEMVSSGNAVAYFPKIVKGTKDRPLMVNPAESEDD